MARKSGSGETNATRETTAHLVCQGHQTFRLTDFPRVGRTTRPLRRTRFSSSQRSNVHRVIHSSYHEPSQRHGRVHRSPVASDVKSGLATISDRSARNSLDINLLPSGDLRKQSCSHGGGDRICAPLQGWSRILRQDASFRQLGTLYTIGRNPSQTRGNGPHGHARQRHPAPSTTSAQIGSDRDNCGSLPLNGMCRSAPGELARLCLAMLQLAGLQAR